jgi:hypothetical protein
MASAATGVPRNTGCTSLLYTNKLLVEKEQTGNDIKIAKMYKLLA